MLDKKHKKISFKSEVIPKNNLFCKEVAAMKETILGEIYLSFSKPELKRLNKYIHYSEWRDSPIITKCHELYYIHAKEKNNLDFTKNELFQHTYPGEKMNDSKLRFTQNRLLFAIKQFIVNDAFEQENIFTSKIWMDFLIDKKLKKNLQNHTQEDREIKNSDYRYLNDYFRSQEESYISFQNPKEQEKKYHSIQKVMDKAQLFSDLVFIKNYCSQITFSHKYNSVPVELQLDKLAQIKSKTDIQKHPEFQVYLGLIDLLKDNNEKSYLHFKTQLFKTLDIWEDAEKINLLAYLLNYTSAQINAGNTIYIDEQYDLFQKFEAQGIFKIKDYINHGRINNVVFIYLRKKEFAQAESFVQNHIIFLNEVFAKSCLHFNLARIQFEKSNYKECLRELLYVDFSNDSFYSLNSKVILIKAYFELKETDALFSLFTSFREYIKKNKVFSEAAKTNCLEFIKKASKIYGATKSKIPGILGALESTPMVEKSWLIQKANELKDSKEK